MGVDQAIEAEAQAQAPMSQPASPTRVNRNAVLLRAVPRRMSEASASMAPAPAQMPSMAKQTPQFEGN